MLTERIACADDILWRLQEEHQRYVSHQRACEMNAEATKDGILHDANLLRARHWKERAAEVAGKIAAVSRERGW